MSSRLMVMAGFVSFLLSGCIADTGDILFHEARGKDVAIFSISEDGRQQAALAKGLYPQWSPDGQMFAYLGPVQGGRGNASAWGVHICDKRGKLLHKIKPMMNEQLNRDRSDFPCFYSWSPDGRKLAVASTLEGELVFRFFDLRNEEVREVYRAGYADLDMAVLRTAIRWIDDERMILTHGSPRGKEARITLLTTDGRPLSHGDLRIAAEGLCLYRVPGGYWTILSARDKTEFALYSEEMKLVDIFILEGEYHPAAQPRDGRLLLRGALKGDNPPLYEMDMATRTPVQIQFDSNMLVVSPVLAERSNKFIARYMRYNDEGETGLLVYDSTKREWTTLKRFAGDTQGMMLHLLLPERKDYSWR